MEPLRYAYVNSAPAWSKVSGVGILERGGQRECGWTALRTRAVDAFLERAEADPLPVEIEALPESLDGHQVVVRLRELASSRARATAT